jgi:endonuclease YncB( thermonuclease family)
MQSNPILNYQSRCREGNMLLALLILLLCVPACGDSKVYEWHDKKGNEHYSDTYNPDAKIIDIKPGYGFYSVKTIYDGDTVQLNDGRKVRFLGINTPEIKHRDKFAEAGGEQAKTWLINKLKNTKVRLEFDVEKTDKYGRTLAYLVTEKKENINVSLVKEGLAVVSIYPPNLLYVNELVAVAKKAEQDNIGIWALPEYTPIPVNNLTEAGHEGWTRLTGKVVNIRNTSKFVYLGFSDQIDARIERKWLFLFPDVNDYLGKTIEVRGWLNHSKRHFSMLIRHPSAIK